MHQAILIVLTLVIVCCSGSGTPPTLFGTIRDLWKRRPGTHVETCLIWTTITLLTLLYAILVVRDLVFSIILAFQLAACLIVLILRLRLPK